jgi:hypothetical protein
VPDGYDATPIAGVFVASGREVPPLPVLIGSILDVVDWDHEGVLIGDATLFNGDKVVSGPETWWEFSTLSSFPFRGHIKGDGSEATEDTPVAIEGPDAAKISPCYVEECM